MDDDTKALLDEIKNTVTTHLAYSKGLNLEKRMPVCELKITELDKGKASWYGLYLITGLILMAFGVAVAFIKVGQYGS